MGDSCHLPQRATSLTGQVYDAVASFLLVTPLVLLFRHGTCTTLEQFVVSKYETRWTAALVLVTIGIVIEVCVTYWQVSFVNPAPITAAHNATLPKVKLYVSQHTFRFRVITTISRYQSISNSGIISFSF